MSDSSWPIACFLGTRPEAVKMAPVIRALGERPGLRPIVINTGQHDELLSPVIQRFGIAVDHDLSVMRPGQSLAGLTARLLEGIDRVLGETTPALSLVQGDTTTSMVGALASFYRQIPVGHVEAGLRTGDLAAPFPEEANRVMTGRLTTLHFPPTDRAKNNLLFEGVPDDRITVTGNTVIDALHMEIQRQTREPEDRVGQLLGPDASQRPIVLITGHRRENFGEGFAGVCRAIRELARKLSDHLFVFPVHLNPAVREPVHQALGGVENIRLLPPQPYDMFVALMHGCRLVLTDSGGVQEEAPGLGKPVLVMRQCTERPEGVGAGTVRLVGTGPAAIVRETMRLLTDRSAYDAMSRVANPYGDGNAAERIVDRVFWHLNSGRAFAPAAVFDTSDVTL